MTTAQHVLEFLNANPDFLIQHPELLPPQTGNVVNFQQLMVNKMRQDKERAESRQRLMVDNARANMTVQARMHAAVLRVVEARTLDELQEIISSEVALMLQVDVATLVFDSPGANEITLPPSAVTVPHGFINHLLGEGDSLLQANINGDARLFGPSARLVKSQALLRLNIAEHVPDGLLCFGSRDPLLFADSQGTELVGFLADITERLLRKM